MSVPEGTPEGTPEQPPGRSEPRPAGWRKATPEKPGASRRYGGAPTHARPAARPASRPPAGGYPVLPPSERPTARPPARRRADELRPYLPPSADRPPEPAPFEARTEPRTEPRRDPQPPVPEHAATPTPAPPVAAAPAAAPLAAPAPPATPAPAVRTASPRPTRSTTPTPARKRAETRAATARPHARNHAPARPPLPKAGAGVERITAGDGEGWLVLLLLGALGIVLVRIAPDLPTLIREISAVVVSGSLAWGLAVRTGGRPIWAAGLGAAIAIGAVVSDWHPLVAGAAVGTGVMGATLAVMMTTPAATFLLALREAVLATAISAVGAIGAVGYAVDKNPEVAADRFGYAVLVLSLVGTFALVYRLGAGLHGLGRRGYVVAGGAVVMLVLALAYSEAIAHWGSRDLVGMLDDFRDSTRDNLGAVPHPIVALLGYPALVWGVFMRARRRQGWWVCAFGVTATAPIATRLVSADLGARSIVLGGLYSFVVGAVVGYLVIRLEQSLTGSHGRRARRDEEAEAHRPEPRRTRPLH
ncbi:MAG: hypothetical protein ACJ72O_13830 [Marmoricola sp.]